MVITFFGHSDFFETKEHAKILISKLKSLILDKNEKIDFLLGDKGKFDYFAKRVCRIFQKEYKNAKLIYVSPYLGEFWEKNGASISSNYDETVYFAEGKIIPKFAYIKRNEWMIQKADYVFFYVHRSYGGAARMLQYAKARNKPFFNLAEE